MAHVAAQRFSGVRPVVATRDLRIPSLPRTKGRAVRYNGDTSTLGGRNPMDRAHCGETLEILLENEMRDQEAAMLLAKTDPPHAAIGHVVLGVPDIAAATDHFVKLGLRAVHQTDSIGILELRGGTHLIVRAAEGLISEGTRAPFDLMVDDVETTYRDYAEKGFELSEIESGSIHSSFRVNGPGGYVITVASSHTSGRPV